MVYSAVVADADNSIRQSTTSPYRFDYINIWQFDGGVMKIRFRLLLLTISMTTLAVIAALFVSSYLIRTALQTDATEKLSAVLEARHSALVRYLEMTHREMHLLAGSTSTASSLADLTEGYAKLGKNAQTLLQQNYLAQGGGHKNTTALSGSDYERAHALADVFLSQRRRVYDWNDMFLVDPHGNVVFSLLKEDDFGTNLITGPWKRSGLARAVTPLLHDAVPGVMSFADFERYAPSDNRPAAFAAMPVFDAEKQLFLGVVAIQLPVQQINELMKDKTGMGESGETFVIGRDGRMLTDSRFRKEGSMLGAQLKAQAISRVLKGESGLEQYPDYRGINVFVAFKPIQPFRDAAALGDHPQWGVIAKIDRDEVYAKFYDLRRMLLLTGVVLALLAVAAGLWGARGITRPLFGLRDALARLSRGESADVPGLARSDEIGDMAKAAEAFRNMTQQVEHDHWIAENVTALTGAVSAEVSLDKAAERVLHILCEKLDVPVGAIYLADAAVYKRVGAHGLARRSQSEDAFPLGVGQVGQCARDNQPLVLSPVPAGLSVISTGLAEFPPHELVLYPVSHKNEVLAVLELAATKSLTLLQHEFLKAASAALGLHLANLQASEHNLVLLVETRKQSVALKEQREELLKSNEEMHALTEELRSQAEEMKAQNEELKASQEELRAQQDEMKHKNLMLETQSAQLGELLAESKGRADDLQRANQYKSEFLANMSHELRTPLNSVLILSRNLAENEEHNLTPDQVESASVISESGTQLLTLINDILDLSKIEAGKLELMKEPFLLDDLLTYLRRVFSPQAEKKGLAFIVQMDPALPQMMTSDRQRLTQVLSNLLSNAIKFTDAGEVSLSVSKDRDDLQFEVTDSGIGIPADKLEHIFGAFQQVDGSTSRKYGGSGLGLAISRHLTRLLGGELTLRSQFGSGSSFTVRLLKQFANPAAAGEAVVSGVQEPSLAVGSAAAKTTGRILVIEDDTRLLAILGRMIRTLGVEPQCVESAEQAMTEIAREAPMGILLDLGLPHMSGMEFLRRLKADTATAQIPVYIMSGAEDSGEAKVLGALGFLKKPVTRDTIAAAIRVMVNEGQAVKRILLVDAIEADVRSVRKLFKQDALEIVSANTGSIALQLLKTQRFDTVILDLQLPDMTGFEWLKQARHLLNPPPVVICSARELSEDEVFELKEITESIVNKGALIDRLREEVLLASHIDNGKIALPASEPVSGKRVLLVDDDARNLFALTRVLRAKGFAIEVASDSARALELLSSSRFDAVLTDIMMPEMDGYALIRQIRALGYGDLPVIAITAKAMQGDDELCLQAGATAYLSKPVDMNSLLEILKGI
jgi:signal transduction histidine kinase/CheY-like chemotaxis protein/HAMP domain-containing protein